MASQVVGTESGPEPAFPASRPATGKTIVSHDSEEKGADTTLDHKSPGGGDTAFTIPDGGWRAWSVVLGSSLVLFCTFGYVNAFGVYQSYYSQHMGKPDSAISWIGSFQLWLLFSLGIVTGKLFDEGYCRHLIAGGSLIYVFSLFMLSLTKNQYYQTFLAQGVGLGIGLGCMFLPATSVISHWFQHKRAYAVGIVIGGSSIGGVVFPIMLNNLIGQIGISSAIRATAYIITGCLIISNMLIAPRLPPQRLRPAHMQIPKPDMKKIISHRAYQFAVAGTFFAMWGIFLPFFYLQIYAQSRGIEKNLAFYSLSILNSASLFGRIFPNFVADKIGPFNMIIPFSFAACILIFGWLGVVTRTGLIVFCLMQRSCLSRFGFFSGAYVSLMPSMLMTLAFNVGEIGVRVGLAFFVVGIGALTGTPIAGALLGEELDWWKPTVFAGTSLLIGTGLLTVARHLQAKDKCTWRV